MKVIRDLGVAGALLMLLLSCRRAGDAAPGVAVAASVREPESLVLRAALPIEAEEGFQPSGLCLHDGQLLTVSDKHDGTIFVLDRGATSARPRPFVEFEPPPDAPMPFDFEGLSVAPGGGFLLVSERHQRVLHVEPEASGVVAAPARGRARWLTPPLHEVGRASGCFARPNAGFEGIAVAPDGTLVLAVEREPRALIELGDAADTASARVWLMEGSVFPVPVGRSEDFCDLAFAGGRLYALMRAAHLLVRLERTASGWREAAAFSYRSAEDDPLHWYEDRTYGLAEGVAIAEREVFLVLDNNGQARATEPADRRPLLFLFERPPSL